MTKNDWMIWCKNMHIPMSDSFCFSSTESNPLFSIIVPVFNTVGFLPKCLDSILRQNFSDFELILVDDGSTDGSAEICDSYATRDSRIKCIHQKNAGVSVARNTGLANARGCYVWFCDSDDTIAQGALVCVSHVISETAPAMVEFAVEQVDCNGNVLGVIPAPKLSCETCCGPLQCGDFLYPFSHIFRIDIAEGEWFDKSLALLEDRDFFYRLAWKAAGNISIINRSLYHYLITRENSAINSSSIERHLRAIGVHENIFIKEKMRGYLMPAFEYFADYAIGTFSLIARSNSSRRDYQIVIGYLRRYRHYLYLLNGSLKFKYFLAINSPYFFILLTRIYGKIQKYRELI